MTIETPSNPLAKLSAAARALAEARDLSTVKQIRDIATAAQTYAKAAQLGLEAQNHAAEVKLRAERKAGELLAQLERDAVSYGGSRRPTLDPEPSEYRAVLDETGTTRQDANRWQKIATLPEPVFEQHIAQAKEAREEITTASMLRIANGKPHVAQNSGESEWYTPAEYIEAARRVMGAIDLDPASTDAANDVIQAASYYTAEDDGLLRPWEGRVWLNPPYSQPLIGRFIDCLVFNYDGGFVTEAIVLVNNATETEWFSKLISCASVVCFPRGRVRFWAPPDLIAAPLQGQAIIYLGGKPFKFMAEFRSFGWIAQVNHAN